VHTQLDDQLKDRLPEFEDLFINSCIDSIQEQLELIEKRTPEEKLEASKAITMVDKKKFIIHEKRISNAMRCLTRLIQNSEREGTFGLTSHRSFAQGMPIPNI
jgi:CCR4-NOT transcriptional regulation complex NOT5 subunit